MKRKVLSIICGAAMVVIAAINVNLFVENDLIANVSLATIEALARNEGDLKCSICGKTLDQCSCDFGITCSYGGCHGKWCHEDRWILICPCEPNGNPFACCFL